MTVVNGQAPIGRKRRGRHSGGLKELGGGRWQIRYDVFDSNGQRLQRSETVQGPKRQAEAVLRERLQAAERGTAPVRRLSVNDFLDTWLDDHVKNSTRPNTLKFYQMITRLYVRPAIGDMELDKVGPVHVQAVVGGVLDKGHGKKSLRDPTPSLCRGPQARVGVPQSL
jgi:hypothetical protein